MSVWVGKPTLNNCVVEGVWKVIWKIWKIRENNLYIVCQNFWRSIFFEVGNILRSIWTYMTMVWKIIIDKNVDGVDNFAIRSNFYCKNGGNINCSASETTTVRLDGPFQHYNNYFGVWAFQYTQYCDHDSWFNPRRAFARVTVVILCVCLSAKQCSLTHSQQ